MTTELRPELFLVAGRFPGQDDGDALPARWRPWTRSSARGFAFRKVEVAPDPARSSLPPSLGCTS